jgi:hypothetical protein
MVGLGFSKDMSLIRYILKLWKLLRGTSGEFGRGRIMFTLGSLRVRPAKNQKPNVQRKAVPVMDAQIIRFVGTHVQCEMFWPSCQIALQKYTGVVR